MRAPLQRRAQRELAKVDLLLVPTALHHYTVEEIQEEEVRGDEVRQRFPDSSKQSNFSSS